MVAFSETYNAIAEGVALTAANTAYNAVSGSGAFTADTVVKLHGAASAKRSAASVTSSLELRPAADVTTHYRRFYIRPTAAPSVNASILGFTHTVTGNACDLRITTAGLLQLRNSAFALIQLGTVALPLNAWSRIEVGVSAGSVSARVFTGAALESATPTETIGGTFTQTAINLITFGGTNTAVWPINVDEDKGSATTWVGPAAVPEPPIAYYDNGASWVNVSDNMYYDNGTTLVSVPL